MCASGWRRRRAHATDVLASSSGPVRALCLYVCVCVYVCVRVCAVSVLVPVPVPVSVAVAVSVFMCGRWCSCVYESAVCVFVSPVSVCVRLCACSHTHDSLVPSATLRRLTPHCGAARLPVLWLLCSPNCPSILPEDEYERAQLRELPQHEVFPF